VAAAEVTEEGAAGDEVSEAQDLTGLVDAVKQVAGVRQAFFAGVDFLPSPGAHGSGFTSGFVSRRSYSGSSDIMPQGLV
jgi:hypothetical protein